VPEGAAHEGGRATVVARAAARLRSAVVLEDASAEVAGGAADDGAGALVSGDVRVADLEGDVLQEDAAARIAARRSVGGGPAMSSLLTWPMPPGRASEIAR
jgi:hypothetical protein